MTDPVHTHEDPKLSALYQATRTPEPSSQLDAAILSAARKATRRRHMRWLVPLSSVALVLIGLSLTLRVIELDRPPLPEEEAAEQADVTPARRALPKEKSGLMKREQTAPSPTPSQWPEVRKGYLEQTDNRPPTPRATRPEPTSERLRISAPTDARETAPHVDLEDEDAVDPVSWLQRIRTLLDEKRETDVQRELQAFHLRFPDYPLPEDLAALVRD